MKVSEIARYWAAKDLTRIRKRAGRVTLNAPFATTRFTLRLAQSPWQTAILRNQHGSSKLKQVKNVSLLDTGCWLRDGNDTLLCIDLAKGESVVSTA